MQNIRDSNLKLAKLASRCSGPRSQAWNVTDRATELELVGADIIHLGVGDPDFATPQEIVDVAAAAMSSGRTHYAPIPGEAELRNQIAQCSEKQYGNRVDEDNVVVFPGAQCALFSVFLCLAEAGDEVIVLEPAYATYDAVVEAGGAKAVRVPLDPDSGFALDVARIRAAITPKTKAILLNSPGNPTGAVFERDAIAALVSLCREKSIWIVSDEVYSTMVFEGKHTSPYSEPGSDELVVVINSLSKSHAMTGWRIGWAIAPRKLAQALISLAQALLFGVSQFSQDAAAFALANDLESVRKMVATFNERRISFCDELSSISSLDTFRPAGGMFLLVGVGQLGMDGEQFANELLDEKGVAVVPGFAFGDSVRNFVRIGFLQDVSALSEAANRIREFAVMRSAK
jgi:arginine:pyruvate transaminase